MLRNFDRPDRLRREYLSKKEICSPRPPATVCLGRTSTRRRGFLFLDGHRLSSLYRTSKAGMLTLMLGKDLPASFLQKYSAGVRGCKTPVPLPTKGRRA